MTRTRLLLGLFVATLWAIPSHADAQSRPAARPAPASDDSLSFRGFADFGGTAFRAKDTFEAIFGTASGVVYGGGLEITERRVFLDLRASRFTKDGERVFVSGSDVFKLGIDTHVTITPFEITGGYRFGGSRSRVVPYAGIGIGWHHYEETSRFATEDENVKDRFTGYHVLGGAEFRVAKYFSIGGEGQYSTVPDAIGQNATSVARAFGESNLGGTTFRIKAVIGR